MNKARFVTGLRAVEQLLGTHPDTVRKLYAEYRTSNPRVEAVIATANQRGIEVQAANRSRLAQISGEGRHQGLVAEIVRSTTMDEAALRDFVEARLTSDNEEAPILLLVLESLQDPHNLGACLRTADAAGVDAVVGSRHGAVGLGPTVSKVAAGAAESLPYATVANIGRTLDWLSEYGIQVVGTSDTADQSLFEIDLAGPLALVMGREHSGLKPAVLKRCDRLVRLPMQGSVSSLNVSVATGVCLYEALRQRRMPPQA
ncbi:MAG: 23S rRNA (guanosine(2251)-2'-O)-methyltransferase RlmB [Woeseia sp.]|nr:23S rRNA (guanosine(2251)-2'-O)-methyltransferase RlmB [Woeseia sp.]MBT8095758.1 23S rRNA (guanosine(2251)-2'-O)-methyltransferase RlmB [Woeseia sp.]NNE60229.1 23S rRNA (guanosine(2251)-2'-O)-methyltransferase RlmB [Woeseia sp.]NNL55154.1 23S rRNA (guanosine(2251)-2'-O)-methyltransferase RlmB [Woeseia sp.]